MNVLALALVCFANTAHAHPEIDRARSLLDEGDFQGALDTLTEAAEGNDLTTADLAALFETRAIAWAALRDVPSMQRELRALAIVAPEHEFDESVHPRIVDAYRRVRAATRGAPRVTARTSESGGHVRIEGVVRNDEADLVRAVRVAACVDDGAWRTDDDAIAVDAAPGSRVSYYVEAVGPGGAILASRGSEHAPLSMPIDDASSEDDSDAPVWPWILVGSGVAVAAGVSVLLFFLLSSEDLRQPTPPILE